MQDELGLGSASREFHNMGLAFDHERALVNERVRAYSPVPFTVLYDTLLAGGVCPCMP
jgi:hypothetical protein